MTTTTRPTPLPTPPPVSSTRRMVVEVAALWALFGAALAAVWTVTA